MSRLKTENLKQCVSILKAFIDEASTPDNKKGIAKLALNQLQRITAGNDSIESGDVSFFCFGKPRADP
ncbi:MAG: hypothetical protein PVH61_31905 [Candidatus Aminicenantes bacterium]|jgi:hypothetical protein